MFVNCSQGHVFAMELSSGDEFYIACDNTGTPLAVFSNNGLLLKQVRLSLQHPYNVLVTFFSLSFCVSPPTQVMYTAYGEVYFDSNPDFVLVIGFHGGLYDPLTRLLHFGEKDYDISAGR